MSVFIPRNLVCKLLDYGSNWILSCNLYVMSYLFEVPYKTVPGSMRSQPQSIKKC